MDQLSKYEGSVTPSFLKKDRSAALDMEVKALSVRTGRVVKEYPPSHSLNRSKLYYEYDVFIDRISTENRSEGVILARNCMVSSIFGGAGDFSRWRPRVETINAEMDFTQELQGYASRVLVVMVDGSVHKAIIVGGLPHGLSTETDKGHEDLGHYSVHQFNGVRTEIDNDGQLHITYKGKSDAQGNTSVLPTVAGSGIHLTADGSIKLNTSGEEQFLFFDHSSHAVSLQAHNDINIKSTLGGMKVNTVQQIDINSTAGLIKTSSLGVHHGLATDAMVKGTTYRAAETVKNTTEGAAWASDSAANAALAAYLGTAAAAWSAVGPFMLMLDPTSTTTNLSLAAAAGAGAALAACTAAAAAETAAATAVSTFEGAAPTYLSIKNMLD